MADPKGSNVRDKEVQAADRTRDVTKAESPHPLATQQNRTADLAPPPTGRPTPSAPPETRSQSVTPQQEESEPSTAPPQVRVVVSQNVNQQQTMAAGAGVLRRNWQAALTLSILLGWLGIDSFYLGQPGKGILKLFTLGLFGILWLVDIIMVATKSVRNIEWT